MLNILLECYIISFASYNPYVSALIRFAGWPELGLLAVILVAVPLVVVVFGQAQISLSSLPALILCLLLFRF